MGIKHLLKKVDFSLSKEELSFIRKETGEFVSKLKSAVGKSGTGAEVFVGGSFAKGTLARKERYDVDIFARFDWEYENISDILEGILKKACGREYQIRRLHGSRDYFIIGRSKKLDFEVIPVTKIKHPKEARNVTDLSYFHVGYVKKKVKNTELAREIVLAKKFCKAQGVYGAESYISGISGYGLECLIIYYRSFEKMLREIVKAKERIIIDPEKKYKKKGDVLFELNESKLASPIVLVDPTWRERNVLAALSRATFEKFQKAAREFLRNPSEKFFEEKKIDANALRSEARAKSGEFVHVALKTGRQAGDIAGTKLKKFSEFLSGEIAKYFNIIRKEFEYSYGDSGNLYIIAKSKGEIIRAGPPAAMKEHAKAFRKENKDVFEKSGILHSRMKIDYSAKEFLNKFKNKNRTKLKEMSITGFSLHS